MKNLVKQTGRARAVGQPANDIAPLWRAITMVFDLVLPTHQLAHLLEDVIAFLTHHPQYLRSRSDLLEHADRLPHEVVDQLSSTFASLSRVLFNALAGIGSEQGL